MIHMKLCGLAAAMALAFTGAANAQTGAIAPERGAAHPSINVNDAGRAERQRIEQEYRAARERCNALSGNEKDLCVAEAKGRQKVAKAELDAKDRPDDARAQRKLAEARANAEYSVAKEKCDDMGEQRDACIRQARAARDSAKQRARAVAQAQAGAGER
jgi:hypothetical protein